jgi:hypothetical protein
MSEQTVPELRAAIKELDPQRPTSKLRKAELVTLLAELTAKRTAEAVELDRVFSSGAASLGEPQVYQGAMHEAEREATEAVDQVINEELADVAPTTRELASGKPELNLRKAARDLARVAWANQVATVRSMGHTVRGQVVDVVLREPGEDGMGRVCLVIQHRQRAETRLGTTVWESTPAYRRTLHRLVDVQFEPVAS